MFIPVGKYLFGKVAPLLLLLPLAALPDAILAVKIDQLFGLFSTQWNDTLDHFFVWNAQVAVEFQQRHVSRSDKFLQRRPFLAWVDLFLVQEQNY